MLLSTVSKIGSSWLPPAKLWTGRREQMAPGRLTSGGLNR